MKVGLFFGSFNPVHAGHLILAQALLNSGRVDRVWFVVSPHNPLKDKKTLAPETDRLQMVEMACQGNDQLVASNVEFLLPQPSYTIDTLTHLAARYPSYTFSLLMGEDNLRTLHRWKNYEALLRHYTLHVYPRVVLAGEKAEATPALTGNIQFLSDVSVLDISATRIRNMVAAQQSIRYLVPDSVIQFIEQRGLYVR